MAALGEKTANALIVAKAASVGTKGPSAGAGAALADTKMTDANTKKLPKPIKIDSRRSDIILYAASRLSASSGSGHDYIRYGLNAVVTRYKGRRIECGTSSGLLAVDILRYIYQSLADRTDRSEVPDEAFINAVQNDTLDNFIHSSCEDCPTWYYSKWCQERLVVGSTRTVLSDDQLELIRLAFYGTAENQCPLCLRRTDKHQKWCELKGKKGK
jgi:hypothetical protein